MGIGKIMGNVASKMFKPQLVEHVPGQKRVYQNVFGKTTLMLEEETKSAGDILGYLDKARATHSPAHTHWVNLDANFPLSKLPKDTPVKQERFWAQRDRSFIDKIICYLSPEYRNKSALPFSNYAPRNCDTKIEGKLIHNMRTEGYCGGNAKLNITFPNMKALLAKFVG